MTELRQHGCSTSTSTTPLRSSATRNSSSSGSVSPASLHTAGETLADHREAAFVTSTTGPTNLFAAITCADTRALHHYLTGPVAALPSVAQIETAPVIRTLKRAGLLTPPTPRP